MTPTYHANKQLTLSLFVQHTVIGRSTVCAGLGLFNVTPVRKGELVAEYFGEQVNEEDLQERESWSNSQEFYNFRKTDFTLIDSKYFGNKVASKWGGGACTVHVTHKRLVIGSRVAS